MSFLLDVALTDTWMIQMSRVRCCCSYVHFNPFTPPRQLLDIFMPTTDPLAAIVLLFPAQETLKSRARVQTRGLHACFEKKHPFNNGWRRAEPLTRQITSLYWPCLCARGLDSSCSECAVYKAQTAAQTVGEGRLHQRRPSGCRVHVEMDPTTFFFFYNLTFTPHVAQLVWSYRDSRQKWKETEVQIKWKTSDFETKAAGSSNVCWSEGSVKKQCSSSRYVLVEKLATEEDEDDF